MKGNRIIVTYYNVLVNERMFGDDDAATGYMESYPQYVQVSETIKQ